MTNSLDITASASHQCRAVAQAGLPVYSIHQVIMACWSHGRLISRTSAVSVTRFTATHRHLGVSRIATSSASKIPPDIGGIIYSEHLLLLGHETRQRRNDRAATDKKEGSKHTTSCTSSHDSRRQSTKSIYRVPPRKARHRRMFQRPSNGRTTPTTAHNSPHLGSDFPIHQDNTAATNTEQEPSSADR